MQFDQAWPGRRVRTLEGQDGTIVSRANGTVYVMLQAGDFRRLLVAHVETLDDDEPPPRRIRAKANPHPALA
jgi:hypothetical protein